MSYSKSEDEVFKKYLLGQDITIVKTWDGNFRALKGTSPSKVMIGEWSTMKLAVKVMREYIK